MSNTSKSYTKIKVHESEGSIHISLPNGNDIYYNTERNLLYHKVSNGFKQLFEHDIENNLIHTLDSFGCENVYMYNDNNELIHTEHSNASEKMTS